MLVLATYSLTGGGRMLSLSLAAGLGAVCRYQITTWLKPRIANWPLATLIINVLGSFLLGLTINQGPTWFTTGFCGGFTTFSTFNVELITLCDDHRYGTAGLYLTLMIALGLCAAAVGLALNPTFTG